MKSVILDASVYISSANSQDIFHKRTRSFIITLEKNYPDTEIIAPIPIILEVANILKIPIQETMTIFDGAQIVELTADLMEKIIPIFKLVRLKTADAVIVACAKIFSAELISWDKKLLKEAKKLVKAYTPKEVG